jgi:AraC-like DNA-binding protein/quercetin dioxygenase-like cupin family protein
MDLENYVQYKETTIHKSERFSFNTYLCTIPQDFKEVKPHWHEQFEIIYIKKGSGVVTVNMNPIHVAVGSIIPVLPGEVHSIHGDQDVRMEYENMIFSLSILDSQETADWCRTAILQPLTRGELHFPHHIQPSFSFYPATVSALKEIEEAGKSKDEASSMLVKAALLRFFYVLYHHRIHENDVPADAHAQMIKDSIQYIHDHYREKVSIADAANAVGFSSPHFMRIFKAETGDTFLHSLNDYRLEMACFLLRQSNMPVSEAAAEAGFDNLSYFIRLFRRRYNTTPARWRASIRRFSAATSAGTAGSER